MEVTLNTKLSDIGYDNADSIGEDLISADYSQEFGWAWERVTRNNEDATVADLKAALED